MNIKQTILCLLLLCSFVSCSEKEDVKGAPKKKEETRQVDSLTYEKVELNVHLNAYVYVSDTKLNFFTDSEQTKTTQANGIEYSCNANISSKGEYNYTIYANGSFLEVNIGNKIHTFERVNTNVDSQSVSIRGRWRMVEEDKDKIIETTLSVGRTRATLRIKCIYHPGN